MVSGERRKSTAFRTTLAAKRYVQWLDSLDAKALGSRLRRGLDYVDRVQEQPHGDSLRGLLRPVLGKVKLEQILPTEAFIRPGPLPRFVGGVTGRTGTTWLVDSIGRHLPSAYNVINEIGLFNYAQFRHAPHEYHYYATRTEDARQRYLAFLRRFVLDWAYDSKKALENGPRGLRDLAPRRAVRMSLDELEVRLENVQTLSQSYVAFGEFYTWLFNFHALVTSGEALWINKELAYGRHADDLFRMLPHAKLVVMTRDGRDVALSMVEQGWHSTVQQAVDRWRDFTHMTLAALEKVDPDRYMLVRYEDMVADYTGTITRVLAFFELPTPCSVITEGRIRPVSSSVRRWEAEMTPSDADYFSQTCSSVMSRLGYLAKPG